MAALESDRSHLQRRVACALASFQLGFQTMTPQHRVCVPGHAEVRLGGRGSPAAEDCHPLRLTFGGQAWLLPSAWLAAPPLLICGVRIPVPPEGCVLKPPGI